MIQENQASFTNLPAVTLDKELPSPPVPTDPVLFSNLITVTEELPQPISPSPKKQVQYTNQPVQVCNHSFLEF